jgi:hypothetical protein
MAVLTAVALAVCLGAVTAPAADWSTTELQWQYGDLDQAYVGGSENTMIWTWQHASGWKYGDNFFFLDWLDQDPGFDAYGEWYSNFSLGKITGNEMSMGPISDVGLLWGFNFGADPDVRIYLPGARLSWDVPGFAFFNTDFFAYLPDNDGVASGGAPDEEATFFADWNFSTKTLELGPTKWNIEGHVEYNAEADFKDVPGTREYWILGQPQVRCDISDLLGFEQPTVFAGIEYQFWVNKLGDPDTDESAVQALIVWRL